MASLIGQQLGNYYLTQLIGQGGFAEVFLGEHIHLGTLAAIKVLKAQVASENVQQFRNEARIIANLKHPHIVPVLDFGVQNGTPFLVMEYASNRTLRQRHPPGVLLPPEKIIPYLKQVTAALQYAHDRKVIHRDIKTENMLLSPNNTLWLSDFGIALIAQTTQADSSQDIIGTFLYIAPEVIQGHPCAASDQYALGIIVYEWLSGTTPFKGTHTELAAQHLHTPPPSMLQHVPTLAPAIDMVVLKALAKDPQQRFARVQDFVTDLEQACESTKRPSSILLPQPLPLPSQPLSSPLPTAEAALVGPAGRTLLGPTIVTIGRLPDNQFVLNDPQVSSRHAEVRPQGRSHTITDIGSRNGTFVNGQRLPVNVPHLLNASDAIRLGTTTLSYESEYGSPSAPTVAATLFTAAPIALPPLSTPPKPLNRSGWTIALLVIAVLILLVTAAIPIAIRNSQIAATNANATAQANNNTVTAQTNNSATAQANAAATATVQTIGAATATATAAQNLYTTITSGTPVLNDPLNDNSQGNQWTENGSNCQFTGSAYDANSMQTNQLSLCLAAANSYANFAYQVQMTIAQGDAGCIAFRNTAGSGYIFCIGRDGSYIFIVQTPNNSSTTLAHGSSSAITTGLNQTNTVTVIAQSTVFDFYINGQYVFTASDSTISQGFIGVGAFDNTNPTDVTFSNAEVWML